MSSLRNFIPKRTYKERSQPSSRKKFGLLEKHKDYVERAKAFHKKQDTLRRLREKAANRNPDEFYFKMVRTKTVDGVHRPASKANKLTKTQDMGYLLQKVQTEKKRIEELTATLHSMGYQASNKHILFAEDRKTDRSHIELKARRNRLSQLKKNYMDMAMQKELQKKGKKRNLRGDEIACPSTEPVYKWRAKRKR